MSKFVPSLPDHPSSERPVRTLYHCIPVEATGDAIKPSLGYGTNIPQVVKDQLSITGDEKAPLVFATSYFSKALTFGFNYRGDEILMNGSIAGTDAEMALVCNRDKTMSCSREITVYSFSGENFADLPHTRQCVSTQAVPFSKTQIEFEAKNAEDLMRAGLQIFSFKESFAELQDSIPVEKQGDILVSDLMKEKGHIDFNQFLGGMVREGTVVWENQARGINPNPVLGQQIGVELKAPQQRAVAKKPFAPKL